MGTYLLLALAGWAAYWMVRVTDHPRKAGCRMCHRRVLYPALHMSLSHARTSTTCCGRRIPAADLDAHLALRHHPDGRPIGPEDTPEWRWVR